MFAISCDSVICNATGGVRAMSRHMESDVHLNCSPEGSQTECHNSSQSLMSSPNTQSLKHGYVLHYLSAQIAEQVPLRFWGWSARTENKLQLRAKQISLNRIDWCYAELVAEQPPISRQDYPRYDDVPILRSRTATCLRV